MKQFKVTIVDPNIGSVSVTIETKDYQTAWLKADLLFTPRKFSITEIK